MKERHLKLVRDNEETSSSKNDELGPLLRDTYRSYTRAISSGFGKYGIGLSHWFFLCVLWEQDGLTQRELSERVGTMEPTTVSALNSMERRGLVTRCRNVQDRRKINVFLTDRGRSLRDVLRPHANHVGAVALSGFEPDQRLKFIDGLHQLKRNLFASSALGNDGQRIEEETL